MKKCDGCDKELFNESSGDKISLTAVGEFAILKKNDKDICIIIENFKELVDYIMSKNGNVRLKPLQIIHDGKGSIMFSIEEIENNDEYKHKYIEIQEYLHQGIGVASEFGMIKNGNSSK